ncbi:MAG: nucleotidyltransferase family protein [Clostridia bacterium]|nr:nucleotidyltransferase family protein [Clostridia bacterium]
MQAVIMAGGYGTRLRPLTNVIPKPMVPIIDQPLIEYIVKHLKRCGFEDIIITLGYKPEDIMSYLGNGEKYGVKIRYNIESSPLGTAGSVKAVYDMLDKTFLVISGDSFTNIDLYEVAKFHATHAKAITMVVKEMEDVKGFGVVKFDEFGDISSFVEKPEKSNGKFVNTGMYMIEKKIMQNIPDGKYDFSRDFFPEVLEEMKAYVMNEFWSDIGTLSSYYLTNNEVALNPQEFGVSL